MEGFSFVYQQPVEIFSLLIKGESVLDSPAVFCNHSCDEHGPFEDYFLQTKARLFYLCFDCVRHHGTATVVVDTPYGRLRNLVRVGTMETDCYFLLLASIPTKLLSQDHHSFLAAVSPSNRSQENLKPEHKVSESTKVISLLRAQRRFLPEPLHRCIRMYPAGVVFK